MMLYIIIKQNQKKQKERWSIINPYVNLSNRRLSILDVGGAAGGFLDRYRENHDCYLMDFDNNWLNFAKKKGINVINGGLDKVFKNKKFDLIILNHVVEHWSNFHEEIKFTKNFNFKSY